MMHLRNSRPVPYTKPRLVQAATMPKIHVYPKKPLRDRSDCIGWVEFIIDEPTKTVELDIIRVTDEFQRKGIGTLLLKSMVAYCKTRGIETLESGSISPDALKLRKAVFGDSAHNFYNFSETQALERHVPIDLSIDELITARQDMYHPFAYNNDDNYTAIGALVDLTKIDTKNWPLPLL